MSLEPGTVVGGDYRVVAPLRAGGMGAVYVATQISTGRARALKLMHRELIADTKLRDRFIQESRIAATIESEHVVEVVAAGFDEKLGMPWLAMELLEGRDLAEVIDDAGGLPFADVKAVFTQLLHALASAHDKGIVHRDLKPDNVFIARTKRQSEPFVVKVLDFGIAKVVADARASSATTASLGTPLYMAPEQTESRGKIKAAADVWALGLIAFRALTGKHYWRSPYDESSSIMALMREVVMDPLPPASERAREQGSAHPLPDGFDAWFARCVAREPADRFPDAKAVRDAFESISAAGAAAGASVLATTLAARTGRGSAVGPPSGPVSASGATAAMPSSDPAFDATAVALAPAGTNPHTKPEAGRSGRGPMIAVGAVLGAGAIAGIVALLLGRDPPRPDPAPVRPSSTASAAPTPSMTAAPSATPSASPSASSTPVDDGRCPPAMAYVPEQTFMMGARDGQGFEDEHPQHRVTVTPYCIDITEVTVRAYAGCVDAKQCGPAPTKLKFPFAISPADAQFHESWCNGAREDRLDHPANCMTFDRATAFCAWRGGHLPTEAQWEIAARGVEGREYAWGNDAPTGQANACIDTCAESEGVTGVGPARRSTADADGWSGSAPVGSYPQSKSPFGLLDMSGNVWEWTADWYGAYGDAWITDPSGAPQGKQRVFRGGGWRSRDVTELRTRLRRSIAPDESGNDLGFRCAARPSR